MRRILFPTPRFACLVRRVGLVGLVGLAGLTGILAEPARAAAIPDTISATPDGVPTPTPAVTPDAPAKAEASSETAKPAEPEPPALPLAVKEAIVAGNKAFQEGDFKAAKRAFGKMLELMPGHPSALINLATAEYRLGNAPEAERLLREALKAKPDADAAWVTLGIICLDSARYYDAIAAFSTVLARDPNNARAHSYLGVTFGRQNWFFAAEAELRKALELAPESADTNFNLALTYLNRTPPSLELARRHYNAALDLGAKPDPIVEKKLAAPSAR